VLERRVDSLWVYSIGSFKFEGTRVRTVSRDMDAALLEDSSLNTVRWGSELVKEREYADILGVDVNRECG